MADLATLGIQASVKGVKEAGRDLDGLAISAERVEVAADRAGRSVVGLSGPLRTLATAFVASAAAAAVGSIGSVADEWSDLTSRVNLASGSMERGAAVMQRLQKIANDTYSSLRLTAEGYIENATTLQALGKSTQDALDYTAALNNAMVISGARAERAERVQLALSRAMALGKLSGNELNTVIRDGGAIVEALADELGVSVIELRKLGSQGKITGNVIYNALTKRAEEFAEKAEQMPATIGDAFQRIQNNFLSFVGGLDQSSGASGALAEVLLRVADNIDRIVVTVGTAITAFGTYYVGAMAAAAIATGSLTKALTALRVALVRTGIGAIAVILGELVYQLLNARMASNSWGEAFQKVGQRIRLIMEGIRSLFYALVDGMKAAWASGMAYILKSTEDSFGPIAKILGRSFDGFGATIDDLKKDAADFATYSGIQMEYAGEKFAEAFAKFDTDTLVDLSDDTNDVIKLLDDMGGASKKAADAYARIIQSAKERLDQLELEEQLVGKTGVAADAFRFKLDLLHEAQRAGLDLTPKQIKELNGLADAYGKVATRVAELQLMEDARFDRSQIGRSAIDQRIAAELRSAGIEMESAAGQAYASFVRTTDQIRIAQDETKRFASGFISDILNGKSALESLTGALQKLGDKLIDLALDSAINSLFGNLLGVFGGGSGSPFASSGQLTKALGSGGIGLYAQGGVTDRPAIFGEAGPEAAVPLPDGRSIPVTLNSGASAAGPSTVNSGNVYNFTGTHEEFEQFKRFVEERDRQFDARAVHAVNKGSKKERDQGLSMAILPAITNIFEGVGIVDQRFQLVSRQEFSRTASGVTIGRDLGPALWQASYTLNPVRHEDVRRIEARLNSLNGVTRGFYAGDIRGKYPSAYPDGNFTDSGVISSINANGRMLTLTDLPAGFQISAGNYMEYDYGTGNGLRALLQVVNDVTASGGGVAVDVEFRPFIPPGTAVGAAVRFKNPRALFTLDPEGVEQTVVDSLFTQLSFSATQSFLR